MHAKLARSYCYIHFCPRLAAQNNQDSKEKESSLALSSRRFTASSSTVDGAKGAASVGFPAGVGVFHLTVSTKHIDKIFCEPKDTRNEKQE